MIAEVKLERKALTIPEAAAMLAMSEVSIRRMLKSGVLKAVRASPKGSYRIPITEIDRYLTFPKQESSS